MVLYRTHDIKRLNQKYEKQITTTNNNELFDS